MAVSDGQPARSFLNAKIAETGDFFSALPATAADYFEQKSAKSRGLAIIKGNGRIGLAVPFVALAKDGILARADAGRFVTFAIFCKIKSYGCLFLPLIARISTDTDGHGWILSKPGFLNR